MLSLPVGWCAPNFEGLYPNLVFDRYRAFKHVPYDQLPPISGEGDSFDWLPPLPRGRRPLPLVHDCEEDPAALAAQVSRVVTQARALGLEVPSSFSAFTSTPRFAARIASALGGYFEVGDLEPVPGTAAGPARLVRFFVEPQTYTWALLLEPGGSRVVFGSPDPESLDRLSGVTECAPSFDAFIKRFWIENALAYALGEGEPPPHGELASYLAATAAVHRSPE